MKILFIAPYPPPHTGNSLPVKVLHDHLNNQKHDVEIINLSKKNNYSWMGYSIRIISIIKILLFINKVQKKYDIIYLTIGEGVFSNFRDLIIYFICRNRLNTMVIHMLGGANMVNIFSKRYWPIFILNKYFIKNLFNVIVEGGAQKFTFSRVIKPSRIQIIPNFSEDYLFVDKKKIENKYQNTKPLKILFLSNMLTGKGHIELAKAYKILPETYKFFVEIDFAGKLLSNKNDFISLLNDETNLKYHGSVSGEKKRKLFSNAHIFCLPTYYRYEGQPFSIIEAYASGAVVITTDHSGIGQIFENTKNGFYVEKKSVSSIRNKIVNILDNKDILIKIAIYNNRLANNQYKSSHYLSAMDKVFNKIL